MSDEKRHPATMGAGEIAAEFRRSADWFYRSRAALEAQGFPAPLPGAGLRWSRALVMAWFEADRDLPADDSTPPASAEQRLWAQRLANRIPAVVDGLPGRRRA